MFALKYINRHLFMEHEGRLYLVDTGCPKSFAINGVIPWVDRTPHAVVLDMEEGRLRFAGENGEVSQRGLLLPFTKAPRTQAPIINCDGKKMIWDTGAQIGYIDMSTVRPANIVRQMGGFRDFSPTYRTIESPMTWLVRFNPEPDFSRSEFVPYIHCQMAEARADILADLRNEGADGVLGNSWMGDQDSLTSMLEAAKGRCGGVLMGCNEGVIVAICGRKGLVRIQNLPVWIGRNTRPPFDEAPGTVPPYNLPVSPPVAATPNPMRVVARRVPSSLGPFSAEGLRSDIQLDNIDGLIGNDLLQNTLL
jgi:hypothetical protein